MITCPQCQAKIRVSPITIGDLVIRREHVITTPDGQRFEARPVVSRMVVALARADGHILDRATLIASVWGEPVSSSRLQCSVRRARAALRAHGVTIRTEFQGGSWYRLVPLAEDASDA